MYDLLRYTLADKKKLRAPETNLITGPNIFFKIPLYFLTAMLSVDSSLSNNLADVN
jgi:hypothetical protein